MHRRTVLIGGSICLVVGLAGCSSGSSGDDDPYVRQRDRNDTPQGELEAGALVIGDHQLVDEDEYDGRPFLSGYVRNEGEVEASTVVVTVEFIDSNGDVIGDGSDGIGNIDPGDENMFTISIPIDASVSSIEDYELSAAELE